MERTVSWRGRNGQVEGERETLLWWKWICTLLVLLFYFLLVVLWIPGKLSSVKAPRAFVLDDQALYSASSSLSTISTACENFLLTGGECSSLSHGTDSDDRHFLDSLSFVILSRLRMISFYDFI